MRSKSPKLFQNWPFPPSERALLSWIRSPSKDPLCNQNFIKIAFIGKTTGLSYVTASWGLIPVLRLGQYYQNGAVCNASLAGDREIFNLGETSHWKIQKANKC